MNKLIILPGMIMAGYKLTEEIIKLSTSKKWDEAKLEWILETIYSRRTGNLLMWEISY